MVNSKNIDNASEINQSEIEKLKVLLLDAKKCISDMEEFHKEDLRKRDQDIKNFRDKLEEIRANNNSFVYSALAKVQAELPIVQRNNTSFGKQSFASFADIIRYSRPILTKYGLSITQCLDYDDSGREYLITRLCHSSGQCINSRKLIPTPLLTDKISHMDRLKEDGKSLSYFSRVCYSAILTIATEDSD